MELQDYTYGGWSLNPIPVVIDQGINVTDLTAVATGSSGAVVNYPTGFTTGGASPGAVDLLHPAAAPHSPSARRR